MRFSNRPRPGRLAALVLGALLVLLPGALALFVCTTNGSPRTLRASSFARWPAPRMSSKATPK